MAKNASVEQLGRSALWSVINQSLSQFLVFFVFLVTARFVSKADFGIMAMALLAIEFFRQILIESVGITFLAKKDPSDDDYSAGFFVIAVGGFLSAALIFSLAKSLAEMFGHSDTEITLKWISLILLTTGLSKMQEVWLTKSFRFKILAIRSITSICIGGGIGIVMAVNGYGINSLIFQQIITALISTIWLWFSCPWRPNLNFRWKNIAEILKYGKHASLNSTANFLGNQSDVALSSYYLGPSATGVYNATKRMLTAISMIIGSGLNSVALPALASISNDELKLQKSFLTAVGLTAILTAPMYSALAVLSPDIIYILLGSNWNEAAPILAILSITGFSRMITQYSINILFIKQKIQWQTMLALVDAAINIIFLFVFAKFGLIYLAFSFVAKTLIFAPVVTGLALYLLKIRYIDFLKILLTPITTSIGVAGIVFLVRDLTQMPPIFNLLILLLLGGISYIILFYFFDKKTFFLVFDYFKKSTNNVS